MNAVLKTEAVAIEAAAPLEMADPSKNLILVPLSQLLPRALQAQRPQDAAPVHPRTGREHCPHRLAAKPHRHPFRRWRDLRGGGRRSPPDRLEAAGEEEAHSADYEVPCLLVADASARTVSLAENVQRENMHPADQFAAFAALVRKDAPSRTLLPTSACPRWWCSAA